MELHFTTITKFSKISALFIRLNNWKNHLLVVFISLFYLLLPFSTIDQLLVYRLVFFFLSAIMIACFGYWINDSFDIPADKITGKKNMTNNTTPLFRIALGMIFLFLGMVFWYLSKASNISSILLGVLILLLILYSVPPIRLKNRSSLGLLCDAHYSHILPVFIVLTFFDTQVITPITGLIIYFLLLFKGLRNILIHQIDDRKGDRKAQIKSFPLKVGPNRTIVLINRVILPLEFILILLSCFIYINLSIAPLIGIISCVIFYAVNIPVWNYPNLSTYERKYRLVYLLNDFYEIWLPVAFIWASALPIKYKTLLTLIHLLVFYKGTYKTFVDLKKIGANMGLYHQ